MKRELTCINCPLGCIVCVEYEGENILSVEGNSCPRGESYAKQEIICPTRTVTATVATRDSRHHRLPVKTVPEIRKDDIFRTVEAIRQIEVTPPVRISDVIVENIAGTGSNLVATGNLLD